MEGMMAFSKKDLQSWAKRKYGTVLEIERVGTTWIVKATIVNPGNRKETIEVEVKAAHLDVAQVKFESVFMEKLEVLVKKQEDDRYSLARPGPPIDAATTRQLLRGKFKADVSGHGV